MTTKGVFNISSLFQVCGQAANSVDKINECINKYINKKLKHKRPIDMVVTRKKETYPEPFPPHRRTSSDTGSVRSFRCNSDLSDINLPPPYPEMGGNRNTASESQELLSLSLTSLDSMECQTSRGMIYKIDLMVKNFV